MWAHPHPRDRGHAGGHASSSSASVKMTHQYSCSQGCRDAGASSPTGSRERSCDGGSSLSATLCCRQRRSVPRWQLSTSPAFIAPVVVPVVRQREGDAPEYLQSRLQICGCILVHGTGVTWAVVCRRIVVVATSSPSAPNASRRVRVLEGDCTCMPSCNLLCLGQ